MSLKYQDYYRQLFYNVGITGYATKHIHKAIEKNIYSKFSKVLEIGGGEGFHLEYITHSYGKYFLTDIDLRPLCDHAKTIQRSGKLIHQFQDASKLTYRNNQFDRVIFMCVLHHVSDVENSLKEARRVCKSGGLVSIYLPTDPGIFYRLMRKIFTASKARKLKINYEYINSLSHRNHFYSVINILKHEFKGDVIKFRRRPFLVPFYDLNLYYVIQVTIKK